MFVCVCVFVCVSVCTCMHVSTSMSVCMHARTCDTLCVYTHGKNGQRETKRKRRQRVSEIEEEQLVRTRGVVYHDLLQNAVCRRSTPAPAVPQQVAESQEQHLGATQKGT